MNKELNRGIKLLKKAGEQLHVASLMQLSVVMRKGMYDQPCHVQTAEVSEMEAAKSGSAVAMFQVAKRLEEMEYIIASH